MTRMTNDVNTETNVAAGLVGDKYLFDVVSQNEEEFAAHIDFDEKITSIELECRKYARRNFLHIEALGRIAEWCLGSEDFSLLGSEAVSLFFCEEMKHMFASMFADRFREYAKEENMTKERIVQVLTARLWELDGANGKRVAMQKWG